MITAMIVDDEPGSIQLLKSLITRSCPSVNIIAETCIPEEAFGLISRLAPELLFLDIDMPGINGLDLAASFPEHTFALIYVSAYDQFAMKAIRTNAVDYLLKPVAEKELVLAVMKAGKRIAENKILASTHSGITGKPALTKIALPSNEGLTLLEISDIIRCQSDGAYTLFFSKGNQKTLVSYNIGEYEKQLRAYKFLRIHNSHLVNLHHIVKYKKGRGGSVVMSDGEEIDVSARKKEDLMRELEINI
jgi:two-component system LytT family response regulator